jgi:hypothetical protein
MSSRASARDSTPAPTLPPQPRQRIASAEAPPAGAAVIVIGV